ncbi:hypothetical protein JVT61DRAFT_8846 [Boletus reticuloceps]|uniref:Uncharacterized protein n=1 Tax=Boletus reticuloceps TaxID=495285 RepID=A0A8I2YH27_9AGAM|nr:hypothetical protein JVT61DRAFT_8846 [Boletus reticuloceps]
MRDILPQRNGFVHIVIEAYNRHRTLIIRPDDVWLAILTQFCFFINGNAEWHMKGSKSLPPYQEELATT